MILARRKCGLALYFAADARGAGLRWRNTGNDGN
jgi:hypothetical protein